MKDIAQHIGLSVQTVGHILGKRAHLFRPQTRNRVLKAVDELGYRRNSSARAMRTGRFDCVAILQNRSSGNSIRQGVLDGVQDVLIRENMSTKIATLPEEKLANDGCVPSILRELSVDGMLVSYDAAVPRELVELITRYRVITIWLNSKQPANSVDPDYFELGRISIREVLKAGHRHIGYLDFSEAKHYAKIDTRVGCCAAIEEAGLVSQWSCVAEPTHRKDRAEACRRWLMREDRPTAVLVGGSTTVPLMIEAARLGIRIPQDLSLVTYGARLFDDPGIAVNTVAVQLREIGRVAAEMLVQRMAHPEEELTPRKIACKYLVGDTLAPPAS